MHLCGNELKNIILPDGSIECLFTRNDFIELVREKLGGEAELYLSEIIREADYTEAKVNTDLSSYEASLESNAACFQELMDSIRLIEYHLNEKRSNKSKIDKVLNAMRKSISNQI